jgi:two-component system nitrogen regulation response regulator GlnG
MAMRYIFSMTEVLAPIDVPVLLRGEPGVGKRDIAKMIHDKSARQGRPFHRMDCFRSESASMETELFGESKAASRGFPGKIECAQGGTLYISEVGNLSKDLQTRLLRIYRPDPSLRKEPVLQHEQGGCRYGVRLIVGTSRDLETDVALGLMQEDFYFFIQGVSLHIPPLRESKQDLPFLAQWILTSLTTNLGRHAGSITEEALKLLHMYHWPGNSRELRDVLQRAVLLASDGIIQPRHLSLPQSQGHPHYEMPPETSLGQSISQYFTEKTRQLSGGTEGRNGITLTNRRTVYHEVIREVEKSMIASAVKLSAGNKLKAARMLGITRTTIRKKLMEYGL